MKPEYNLNNMKRRGHPLREKVAKGEIKLMNISEVPDFESKLAALPPDEREFIINLINKNAAVSKPNTSNISITP